MAILESMAPDGEGMKTAKIGKHRRHLQLICQMGLGAYARARAAGLYSIDVTFNWYVRWGSLAAVDENIQ